MSTSLSAAAHATDRFPWVICPASEAKHQMEPADLMHKRAFCSLCGTDLGPAMEVWS